MRKVYIHTILFLFLTCPVCRSQNIDYTIPYPRALHDAADTLTLFIIGDVMMHSPQFTKDHHEFFKNIAPRMRDADFSIANMEFTLAGPPYSGYPSFSAPEHIASYMAVDCGTDVFLTANNHITDRGRDGMSRTLQIYRDLSEKTGLKVTGTFRDEYERTETYPLMLEKHGFRIALINFTYGTNNGIRSGLPSTNWMDKDEVHEAFIRAKEKDADFIVALPHWGEEYHLKHSGEQEEWAGWLIGEGADVIVGSHPHVVQDTTHINGKPVFFSLGNAVSNMSVTNSRLELAVTLRFVCDRVEHTMRMMEPEAAFMWCTLPGTLTDSYATIFVKEWADRRDDWLTPSDFDNMMETYDRVKAATGIED